MKIKFLLLSLLICLTSAAKKGPEIKVDAIEPPYWWTGMVCDTLQLMVYGQDIAGATARVDYPGVKIVETVRPDSPNYLFLYLTIAPETKPGTVAIDFSRDGRNKRVAYELRGRKPGAADQGGFDATDVLYLIMPDRFADGDPANNDLADRLRNPSPANRLNPNARHGGDIQGIIDHLDYIDSLGVTAVWLCPVLENDMPDGSYHGYATTNYYRIDPRFGDNEKWNELVARAADRGIKVVMDMIFNHSGSAHPWLADMPMADWYNHPDGSKLTNFRLSTIHDPYASDYDLDASVNGWFVPAMPDLNQRNPHLLKYLTQNSIWWIESSGISGIRMDTYPYADRHAMAKWVADVEREYPRFNIVGECWYANEGGEAFWQRGSKVNPDDPNLPTVMDFRLSIDAPKAFTEQTDPWHGLNAIYDHLALDYLFPDPQRILTFLDNHDTDRFLPEMPADLGPWKQAIAFLLTSRGIPQIYYGTELLMNGSKEGSDGYVRRDFPGGFPSDTISAFTPAGRTQLQNEAYDYMSHLLNWRRGAADVIGHGSLKHFMPQHGIYVYQRKLGDRQVTVILNGNDEPLTTLMERTVEAIPYGTVLTDIVTGRPVTIEEEMTFAPRQVMILTNFDQPTTPE